MIPAGILGIFFYREEKKDLLRKEDEELRQQFKELLFLASAGQKAGYSVENAFMKSYTDLQYLYGERSRICLLLKKIGIGLENNISMTELWKKAGKEYGITEIAEFAKVFEIAKESGGNLTEFMDNTAQIIGNKADTKEELNTLLSARKLEQKIMNMMPIALILYVDLTSPGYFDNLYHSLSGACMMSIALIIYIIAYLWGKRLTEITY